MCYQNFIRVMLCLFVGAALLGAVPSSLVAEEVPKEILHESGMYYIIQKNDTL